MQNSGRSDENCVCLNTRNRQGKSAGLVDISALTERRFIVVVRHIGSVGKPD